MIISANPIDYLKYLVADVLPLLESAADTVVSSETMEESTADNVAGLLRAAQRSIVESASVFSRDGDDMNTYSDGRVVTSSVELETGSYFSRARHPQVGHRDDRPRELCTVDNRDGTRLAIMVRDNGLIEAVPATATRGHLKAVR